LFFAARKGHAKVIESGEDSMFARKDNAAV